MNHQARDLFLKGNYCCWHLSSKNELKLSIDFIVIISKAVNENVISDSFGISF